MRTINKILIVRFSSVGDIILTSPLLRVLRGAYPHARIDFLVKAEFAELVKFNGHLSAVHELQTNDFAELAAVKRKIRTERYDYFLDLHNSIRSRYLRFFSGARATRVVNKRAVARFMLVKFKKNYYRGVVPVAGRYLETVKSLGLEDDGQGLEVVVPEETVSRVRSALDKFQLDRFRMVIGLVPGARHATKQWPPERFVETGVQLATAEQAKILVFGGKEDADYCGDIAQMINAKCNANAAESFAGKLSLLETAAVMDRCQLVVTNDTGLMHLAAARKRKIVAIFGSTVKEFGFVPFGVPNAVIERPDVPCRPCTSIGLAACPEKHFDCMKKIQTNEVVMAAQQLLH